MVLKVLAEKAYTSKSASGQDIYFTNACIRDLPPQPRHIWFFSADNQPVYVAKGAILLCHDGIRQVSGQSGRGDRFTHCREDTIPAQCADYKIPERYLLWLEKHADWQPPITIQLGTTLRMGGVNKMTLSDVTDAQLGAPNLHFARGTAQVANQDLEGVEFIFTQQGSLWLISRNRKPSQIETGLKFKTSSVGKSKRKR